MHVQRLNITLPYELARDFKRTIPVKKRSKFIAEAVRAKLPRINLRKELIRSLKANREYYERVGKEIEEDFKYADADIVRRLS